MKLILTILTLLLTFTSVYAGTPSKVAETRAHLDKARSGNYSGMENPMTKVKLAILSGQVTLSDLGTSVAEINMLSREAKIKQARAGLELMKTLDHKSSEYKLLAVMVDDLVRDLEKK